MKTELIKAELIKAGLDGLVALGEERQGHTNGRRWNQVKQSTDKIEGLKRNLVTEMTAPQVTPEAVSLELSHDDAVNLLWLMDFVLGGISKENEMLATLMASILRQQLPADKQ